MALEETNQKICHFCNGATHARKYRLYSHEGQCKHWACSICISANGGPRQVQEILEKLHLPQNQTNFFSKNYNNHLKKNQKRSFYCPSGEFAKFKLDSASAEGQW